MAAMRTMTFRCMTMTLHAVERRGPPIYRLDGPMAIIGMRGVGVKHRIVTWGAPESSVGAVAGG
jgi:hypothetical protein